MLWFCHALRSVLNTITSVSRLIVEKSVDMNDTTYTEVICGAMYNAVIYCPQSTLLLWSLAMVFCFLLEVLQENTETLEWLETESMKSGYSIPALRKLFHYTDTCRHAWSSETLLIQKVNLGKSKVISWNVNLKIVLNDFHYSYIYIRFHKTIRAWKISVFYIVLTYWCRNLHNSTIKSVSIIIFKKKRRLNY